MNRIQILVFHLNFSKEIHPYHFYKMNKMQISSHYTVSINFLLLRKYSGPLYSISFEYCFLKFFFYVVLNMHLKCRIFTQLTAKKYLKSDLKIYHTINDILIGHFNLNFLETFEIKNISL